VAEALLAARSTLFEQLQKLEKRLRSLAREDGRVRRLMTAPGVGTIVALTFASAIDDPTRFRSSKTVGAHFGLTPKKYQSGETDITGRISKIGDGGVRTALYEAANVILTRPVKGSTPEELGDAPGRPSRHAQGQGGARPQARGGSAPHARRRDELPG
jgi:transposase